MNIDQLDVRKEMRTAIDWFHDFCDVIQTSNNSLYNDACDIADKLEQERLGE